MILLLVVTDARRLNQKQISDLDKLAEHIKNRNCRKHLDIYSEDLSEERLEEKEASPPLGISDLKTDTKKLNKHKGDDSGNLTPPGGGGTTTGKTKEENTSNALSALKTTLGLLGATAFFGTTSLVSHFTDFFGEGTTKNLIAFASDCLVTFTGALTISSALTPTSSSKDAMNNNNIVNSNFG